MDTSQVLDEFDRLVREADLLEDDILSPLQDREAVHEAALMLVTNHPEMRNEFVEKFGEILRKHDLEVLEYCMHELRWPEVRAQLEAAARDADDFRLRDIFTNALSAFSDRWSGRGFYERFPE
jgi:hypothetical protein